MDMILDAHCSGKQKYEQLVEIKLSLEMEIQTYRSILEDEEKRIRRLTYSFGKPYANFESKKLQNKAQLGHQYFDNICSMFR